MCVSSRPRDSGTTCLRELQTRFFIKYLLAKAASCKDFGILVIDISVSFMSRELELQNMLNFDAFELVDELPQRKHAYDMVWVDEWRGDRVRSRLCVRQFKAEGLRDDLFAGMPDAIFIKYLCGQSCELQRFRIPRC